jgi:hypothetical protein
MAPLGVNIELDHSGSKSNALFDLVKLSNNYLLKGTEWLTVKSSNAACNSDSQLANCAMSSYLLKSRLIVPSSRCALKQHSIFCRVL